MQTAINGFALNVSECVEYTRPLSRVSGLSEIDADAVFALKCFHNTCGRSPTDPPLAYSETINAPREIYLRAGYSY